MDAALQKARATSARAVSAAAAPSAAPMPSITTTNSARVIGGCHRDSFLNSRRGCPMRLNLLCRSQRLLLTSDKTSGKGLWPILTQTP